jgi:hypothetical protein
MRCHSFSSQVEVKKIFYPDARTSRLAYRAPPWSRGVSCAWSCARGGGTYKRHDETNLDGLESDFKDSISYNNHVHTIIDTRISSRPLIRRLATADWAAPTLLIAYGVFLSSHAPVVFLFELVFKRQT